MPLYGEDRPWSTCTTQEILLESPVMKILYVSPMYYPVVGGGELHLKELCESLALRGHEVTVMTSNVTDSWNLWSGKSGGLPDTEMVNGVKVLRFHPSGGFGGRALDKWLELRGGYRTLKWILTSIGASVEEVEMLGRYPRMLPIIPRVLRCDADIVVSMNWYWPPGYYTYLARKFGRFILVGIPLFHTVQSWSRNDIYKSMLEQCDAVVTNTEYEAHFVHERASVKVEVAGVGVHPDAFAQRNGTEIRSRYQLGKSPLVGFVGRQQANKGVAKLVEAMRIVWQWNPQVRLVLAGHGKQKDIEVESAIERLGSFERQRLVRINEFDEKDKASLYDAFDIFVLPSTEESFGISYLEAWMCHKPVIGARIGSTACVIEGGTDGLLVEPNDSRDIARAIVELLSDPDRRVLMGERGYAKTIEHFTWEKVTNRVERLYLDLIAEAQVPRFRRQPK
jgi:glycosyltransferase involved in cell wall biosynthesis